MTNPPTTPSPENNPANQDKTSLRSDLRNWISLGGGVIALGSFFAFILLFLLDVFSAGKSNAYIGILSYIVAPAFLFLGLALALFGYRIHRKARRSATGAAASRYSINLSNPRDRRRLSWFGLATTIFLLFTALGSYQSYHITESVEFCGAVCHVMTPEFVTYQGNAHARVACAECHVGSGAEWYVKSKLAGTRQLISFITNTYSRPIPTPVHNLRPARDTCEQCHWPEKFTGSIVRTYNHYMSDDANTPFTLKLMINVGGGSGKHTPADGIHWHITNKVEYYASDEKRQTIPWVRVTAADGTATVFKVDDYKDTPAAQSIRTMDCVDCHNRPAHRFKTPNDAVEESLYAGRIDAKLPAIKQVAVDALTQTYATEADALAGIAGKIRAKYSGQAAQNPQSLDATIAAVSDIYRANFFPAMNADWSKYPENVGHKNFPGCFRCHDGNHKAVGQGEKLIAASDCNSCHTILAQGAGAELAKLAPEGVKFKHPGDPIEGLLCNDCHNGKNQ